MDNLVISHMTMRKTIGILALLFPVILIVGGMFAGLSPMQVSMSAYYWTNMNVVFVSFLITFGIFLLSYTGYDKRDNVITSIAGISMILVALFPCEGSGVPYLFSFLSIGFNNVIHYITATVAFISLGVMSYFQFTLGSDNMTEAKKKRNVIYRVCGIIIAISIILIAFVRLIPGLFEATNIFRLFYWLEAVIVWAFGTSWLVKGETILKD